MDKAKVIEFPKDKSSRVEMRNKIRERKATVGLSIASVVLCAVFLNQWMMKQTSSDGGVNGARGVASFDAASIQKDIRWEHDLAKKISLEGQINAAAIAHSPTVRDELIFGFLQGKYGMKLSDGRITKLEFLNVQAGEQPAEIKDKSNFLKKYSAAVGMNYSEVSLASESDNQKLIYNLIDNNKQIVGTAEFLVDDNGRVKRISFLN